MPQPEQPAATGEKPNYKKTLNLPNTPFPMKANLVQNEPASMKRWDSMGVYKRLRASRKGAPRFAFHDGPPYANGSIHLGHLLNKCLKDFVVRSRSMAGMDCPYVPGWDCHGLPIEHKVMTEAVESGKIEKLASLPDDQRRTAIRRTCQADASKYIKLQAGQMQRLLTLADYEHPYETMAPAYEAAVLDVFADMVGEGLVQRRLKAVHWSIDNQTALAEAELEYYDREDLSVFVEFDAADRAAVAQAFGLGDDDLDRTPTLMIWTTTPWTLPANLAIAVNPKFTYALVDVDGTLTVLAEDLVEEVTKLAGAESVRTVATAPGERLIGLRYAHPFIKSDALAATIRERDDRAGQFTLHRVVGADYVTLEDGTGLVHTAPGHGEEDYQTGLREGLPVYCPVGPDGAYDDSAPEWVRGQSVWDANAVIAKRLGDEGRLFHSQTFTHSYPHDWRGKSPVIFRATEQWFVDVDRARTSDGRTLREIALAEVEGVEFVPKWGRNRLRGMLELRPDWCLSRQRSWGLPIPAFSLPDGSTLLTAASVRAVAAVVREKGSDAWFGMAPADLLKGYDPASDSAAPKGVDIASLEKMHDIFDVWFESGSSWNAVLRQRDLGWPADLYLEGSDQHRGWFQLSLLAGVGATGKAPFRTLLTHGFMVDRDGRKMSKSLGNALNVDDLLRDYGADVCRWWVATLSYENDIKVDPEFFKTAGEAYRKVRNTIRFLLSNLSDFDATAGHESPEPTSIDAWALDRCDALSKSVWAAYERYDFRAVSTALYDFCNDTLSAVYLAAVKDRLYCDRPDSPRRRRTQSAMHRIADALCRLLAPILPHTADEAFRALRGDADPDACVHLETWSAPFDVGAHKGWSAVMDARDAALNALERTRAGGGVENPLDAGLTLPDSGGALGDFDPVDLADLLGVSRVSLDPSAGAPVVHDLREEPRCERSWKRDGTVKQRPNGSLLSDRDAEAVGTA